TLQWIVCPKREKSPISDALTVYTDAGKKSRTAAITWQDEGTWKHKILQAKEEDTLQTLELWAVVWAMLVFKEPLNIVTDSLYVAGVVERIEDALIKEVKNRRLLELFM
ncbi:POK19 protein, partial [Thryothorus ludovicianus]|nr:POK19 protein [Thryothorus ludovicianus]